MIKSIYNQTFKDFDIIFVNDGSTDNSEKTIFKYKELYKNIIYIKQSNQGQSQARNNAIPKIKGKYVLFLDSDDYIEETMLQKMYEKAENDLADITICAYRKVYDYSIKEEEKLIFNLNENKIYNGQEVMNMMLDFKVSGYLWNKMFLTKNILKNNMRFEKGRIIEDFYPVFREVSKSNRIIFINDKLYNYRQRLSSTMHNIKKEKEINDFNFACKSICNLIKNNKQIDKKKYYNFISVTQSITIYDCMNSNVKLSKDTYNKYEIRNFGIFEILFDSDIELINKIRLILFKTKCFHIYLRLKKPSIFN